MFNVKTGKKHKLQRLVRMHSNAMEDITEAFAGDICAVFGVDCATGDSFTTDKDYKLTMESMFVPDPVISLSTKTVDLKSNNYLTEEVQNEFQRF